MGNFFDGKVVDYRYNSFTQAFSPKPIGYSGNPTEKKIIPSSAPYYVYCDELPRKDSPSTLLVTGYLEVAATNPPAAGQFRAIYGGDGTTVVGQVGQGILEFNAADAGKEIEFKYYGLGSILQREMLDNSFGSPINVLNNVHKYTDPKDLVISESAIPDMKFTIEANEAVIDSQYARWNTKEIIIIPPVSDTQLYYIVANEDGIDSYISVVAGAIAVSPVFPKVLASQLIIGAIVAKMGATTLEENKDIFIFINGNERWTANIYINSTSSGVTVNNAIIDLNIGSITGALTCSGNAFIVNYDTSGLNGSNDVLWTKSVPGSWPSYSSNNTWTLSNAPNDGDVSIYGTIINGSVSNHGDLINYKAYYGEGGGVGVNLNCTAENIYIYNINVSGGNGKQAITETNIFSLKSVYPTGQFYVGTTGGNGGNSGNITLSAREKLTVLFGGQLSLLGGNGGNGANASSGSVGNLGGDGGDGKDGGDYIYSCKEYTNNGTVSVTKGIKGSLGTGTGGSDNNGNGVDGIDGINGTITGTIIDSPIEA